MIPVAWILVFFMVNIDHTIQSSEVFVCYTVFSSLSKPYNDTEQCLTLSSFANNSNEFINENTTVVLHFQQGEHHLDSTITIRNIIAFYASSPKNRNATIVCNDSSAKFQFYDVKAVTISGLTFVGCTGNEVNKVTQFTLEDSLFSGHEAINGTALVLVETSAKILQTKFRHNYGNIETVVSYYSYFRNAYDVTQVRATAGGALTMSRSNVTLVNSLFEGNIAEAGGAIFAQQKSDITIINSTFVKNEATSWKSHVHFTGGGVIYSDRGNSVVVYNSIFEQNSAPGVGGVIAAKDNFNITIANSDFISNTAHQGGVLFNHGGYFNTLTITESDFIHNKADLLGGVMSLCNGDNSSISITHSDFTKNTAINGGVVHLTNACGALHVSDSHNTEQSKYTLTITASEFSNNIARFAGGAIKLEKYDHSVVEITDSKFTNNSANNYGGVLFLYTTSYSTITITNSHLTGNRAKGHDGGIISAWDCQFIITTINKSDITNNSARNGGVVSVALSSSNHTLVMVLSTFVNNTASQEGGVLYATEATLSVSGSTFKNNEAKTKGGTMSIQRGTMNISLSQFDNNVANLGGVFAINFVNLTSEGINLSHNFAYMDGGVLYAQQGTAVMNGISFSNNRADNNGGTMFMIASMISAVKCTFSNNTAGNDGGVIRSYLGEIAITKSECVSNSAENEGGVFHSDQTTLTINHTSFTENKARDGGVIWTDQGLITVYGSDVGHNNASVGGVIWAEQASVKAYRVNIFLNYANVGTVYLLESNSHWSDLAYTNNTGSLYAYGGSLSINKKSNFANNIQANNSYSLSKEGATITVIESDIEFYGNSLLTRGHAKSGGALKAIHSRVYVHGNVTVANNTATETGGGVYLYHCDLICQKSGNLKLHTNTATEKGGGMTAISSVIKLKYSRTEKLTPTLKFNSNKAMKGGGLSLEMDSKVYILKSKHLISRSTKDTHNVISFSFNSAKYGGAIYVSDDGMCSVSTTSMVNQCFIQTLAMYAPVQADFHFDDDGRCQNIDFVNNTAQLAGNSLFGGLLDRCSVSQLAETNINNGTKDYMLSNSTMTVKGYEYFKKISNIQDEDIGSYPMKVCFCTNGQPDCSYKHNPLQISKENTKGQDFTLSLAVVNQINDSLDDVKIYSHFYPEKYVCQNHVQHIHGSCRNVSFRAFSYNDTEQLVLSFQEGPCKDAPESEARVTLEFFCPLCLVGFQLEETRGRCQCVCDPQLYPYFTNCSNNTLIRDDNVWISSLSTNQSFNKYQYLIHPHCPFDYCHPPSSRVKINLNIINGADAQCANNRAGLLCGVCQQSYSLSLGSSHCLGCSTQQLAILIAITIAAILAGIFLVALLLVLNLTVAIGTLNGIILYANIVFASNSVLLPSTDQYSIYSFIAWLNLEIGFDTCFYVGMDAYSKTLLQLAFPGYVFFLVFLVIIISTYSMNFSRLIGKRNPVATLATLISLSYAKFLQINVASLSFASLRYPNGLVYVWLVDASVSYLRGKHIVLFIIALFILATGVCFTALLLFWQWLLRHQDKPMLRWTKYQKLCHIIEPFHAPFVDKHRYWAGLLFLVRVALYIVFALNVNGDPRVCFAAIILTNGGLLVTKGFLVKVYKKWPIDIMESMIYFNILGFATLMWFFIGTPQRQIAVAYTSVTMTLLFLLVVIAFHVCKFTPLGSVILRIKIFKVLVARLLHNKTTKATNTVNQTPVDPELQERDVSISFVEIPKPVIEHSKPDIRIQLKLQELPYHTRLNSFNTMS